MKKTFRSLAVILFSFTAIFIYQSCKKETKSNQEVKTTKLISDELLAKVKAFQDEETKNGIIVFNRKYSPGELLGRLKSSDLQVESSCIGDLQLELSSVYAEYRNGTCSSNGDYYMYFSFAIRHVGIDFLNANSLPIRIKYTINNVLYQKMLTIQNVKTSRTVVNITTNPILVNEYCGINLLDLEVDPQVLCPDGQTYSGTISVSANIAADRSNQCKSIPVAFVQPNISGNGTVGLNGYIPCQNNQFNPCFVYADQVEFRYRKVGDPTWIVYLLSPYLNNSHVVTGLQAGTYEFSWSSKQGIAPFCQGPQSDIITRVIN